MSRDDAIVLDMLKAACRVSETVQDRTFEEFRQDWRFQSIVQYQMMILGEATKRLSKEFRRRHAEIDWKAIAGHRDVLIHQYDDVDLREVWKIATKDLPPLIQFLGSIAPKQDDAPTAQPL